ncbi:hypothetical protein C8A05DRAFT_13589 [Staphylotrichum tortipilum]|uniref:Uncharacterized protein n=1 Tax=Staphylotrichum tortipilum TaxID=2831512 RepID=A0AAN6RW01_9PEZI|nr:hypothetical protein C8A05DRAFT_13589 [Staphylotrichum longicolle]
MRRFLNALSQELSSAGLRGYGADGFAGQLPQAQVPQATEPCPRQQPQAGHQDWIGLNDARFAAFNVCPTCYHSLVRPTPYAGAFITKGGAIAPPPNVPVRCDMSRFWVRIAGTVLLTMNQGGRHDITLLARVAGIRAQDGECPNAQLTSARQPLATSQRTWYTIQDPQIGAQPLQGWTVCAACLISIQTCCPAIATSFAPLHPPGPRDSTCAFVPSDAYDDMRSGEMLQQVGGCAVTSGLLGRPDVSQLVSWLRENPPRPRGGLSGSSPAPSGLCPRNSPSTTLRCHTMRRLFNFTVCEQCFADVIQPDLARGVELARKFDMAPNAMPSDFTCQLYSDRMRRVWSEAVSTGDFEHLRQKVGERRAKEREVQMTTARLEQQAAVLRIQARTQEHLAINAMSVEANQASNNILVSGIGGGRRVDAWHVEVPSGVPDFSQTTQLNNQAAMLKLQAAQAEGEARMAQEEWRQYWE